MSLSTVAWGLAIAFLFGNIDGLGNFNGISAIPPISIGSFALVESTQIYYLIWGIVVAALISPLRVDRAQASFIVGAERFLEIHVSTPLDVCEAADAKGLYRKARRGELAQFTGVSAPYEAPEAPRLAIDPMRMGLQPAVSKLLGLIGNSAT